MPSRRTSVGGAPLAAAAARGLGDAGLAVPRRGAVDRSVLAVATVAGRVARRLPAELLRVPGGEDPPAVPGRSAGAGLLSGDRAGRPAGCGRSPGAARCPLVRRPAGGQRVVRSAAVGAGRCSTTSRRWSRAA